VTFDEIEQTLRQRLEALPPAARAELIHVLRLPDFDRTDAIGTFWGYPETRTFGELLIDLEEDKAARAVVFGLLGEMERRKGPGRRASGELVELQHTERPVTDGLAIDCQMERILAELREGQGREVGDDVVPLIPPFRQPYGLRHVERHLAPDDLLPIFVNQTEIEGMILISLCEVKQHSDHKGAL
jgi:hypothetical protein